MKRRIALLLFVVLLLLPNKANADGGGGNISVKAELNKAFITIGDPVEYTVLIHHDPNVQVLSTIPPPSSDILKIKHIDEIKRTEGDQIVEGRKFTLTSFRLGEFIIDPVTIEYRVKDAQSAGEEKATPSIETNRLFLTVQSVAKGEQKVDIRGVKAVIDMVGRHRFLFILLILLLLCAGVFFIYYRFFRKAKGAKVSDVPPLSAYDEAMMRLNELFDSDLLKKGRTKEYYLHLSEILRVYFERRFGIQAVEATTVEIIRSFKKQQLDSDLRAKIEEVLEASDLAKFAKWQPEPKEIVRLNLKSKQIVEDSKMPEPKAVSEEVPANGV